MTLLLGISNELIYKLFKFCVVGFTGMLTLYLLLMAGGVMGITYFFSGYVTPTSLTVPSHRINKSREPVQEEARTGSGK